jgi:hypothetical protein
MFTLSGRRLTIALLLSALACCAASCGGEGSGGRPALSATPEQRPELDLETVRKAINGAWVEGVPAADGQGKPQNWGFAHNEPKEIEIVEQKVEGDAATIVVNMKTRSHPRDRRQMSLEGQLRLHLRLETELFFREWDVDDVENISFKYTMLEPTPSPSPPGSPSPAGGASPSPSASASPAARGSKS